MSLQHTLNQAINSRGITAEIYYDYGPTITIKITGNAGYVERAYWRVRGSGSDKTQYYPLTGHETDEEEATFEVEDGKEYAFQAVWGGTSIGAFFTVNFDSGGGSGGGEPEWPTNLYQLCYYDSNLPYVVEQKWVTAGDTFKVLSGSSVTIPKSYYTENEYKITGHANGGTFSNGDTTPYIIATKRTTTNYSFLNWNTNSQGTGVTYEPNSQQIMPYDNLFLYPILSITPSIDHFDNSLSRLPQPSYAGSTTATFTATFDANGGSVSTTSQSVNTTVTKTFGGWMLSSTDTTTIDSLDFEGTVYAKWNDSYSNATIILPLPTRNGYIFNGWSTSISGTNPQSAGAQVPISGDTTFYAIWTEKEKPKGGVFIHDGTKWQLAMSYIYNDNSWKTTE